MANKSRCPVASEEDIQMEQVHLWLTAANAQKEAERWGLSKLTAQASKIGWKISAQMPFNNEVFSVDEPTLSEAVRAIFAEAQRRLS